jgi:predicted transcriptional regulator
MAIFTRLTATWSCHRVLTPEAIAAVEAMMKENRRVTVNEIAAHLDMSHGSAHHIVYDFSAVL